MIYSHRKKNSLWLPSHKPKSPCELISRHPLANGLTGCWIMNEDSGNKIHDLSGHGNHGTITGADWVPDGLDFNGTSDFVRMTDSADSDLNCVLGDITISALFHLDSLPSAHCRIVDKGGANNNRFGYAVHIFDNNEIRLNWIDHTDGSNSYIIGPTAIVGWNHLVVVCDRDDKVYFYLNNILTTGTWSANDEDSIDSIYDFRIGTSNSETGFFFPGTMKYVMAHNRTLTAYEVTQLYYNPYAMIKEKRVAIPAVPLPSTGTWITNLGRI